MTNYQKGHLFNLFSILAMALGPLFSKFGLLHVSPAKASVINVLTIIITSYLFGILTKNRVKLYWEKEIMVLALFNSLGVIFLFLSMNLLSPVEVGFFGRFYTVFAVLLSVVLLKEKISRRETIFITIAIFGAFLFVEKGDIHSTSILGTLFAVIYTFFFALTNIYIKKSMSKDKSSNSILFTNNSITLIFVIVYAAFAGELFIGWDTHEGIGFIIFSSFLTGFLGTILLYQALKYLRFSIANVTRAFSPVLLAIISFPFFPIVITWQNTLGAVLLIGSILLLTVKPKAAKEKQNE
ncbi:DMT family transporter [Ornithinibacillus californiensis]|uniref:DMT family transporter n=1 Tax=Ornithinibacillus californiensis TaxID=161536 RepID=UPI00064DCA9B|nr:DMT family transporter [Ornithinibacillus californiensis]